MPYEKYRRKAAKRVEEPQVTIMKTGNLWFNAACIEKFFEKCENIVYYYDRENKRVGIKPADKDDPDSYPLRKVRGGKGAVASAHGFLKKYKINHSESKSYRANWNEDSKFVEIELQ